MKNKLFVIAIAALVLATLAAGSLAYFSDEVTTHNVITTGGVDIELLEWADADKTEPFADLDGILPGAAVTKIAEVKNTGEADAWVRVSVTKAIELSRQGTPDTALVKLDLNTTEWTDGKDGYLYYNAPVKPGDVTAPVFTTVTFDTAMGNEYQNATATVTVSAEAVQTANNGATALDAAGWPTAE